MWSAEIPLAFRARTASATDLGSGGTVRADLLIVVDVPPARAWRAYDGKTGQKVFGAGEHRAFQFG